MVDVYLWLLADGTEHGCGTEAEFNHWRGEGVLPAEAKLGGVIAQEPASEDERRAAAWGMAHG